MDTSLYNAVPVYTLDSNDDSVEDAYSTQLKEKEPNIPTGLKLLQDQEQEAKSAFLLLKLANTPGPTNRWRYIHKDCNPKVLTINRKMCIQIL